MTGIEPRTVIVLTGVMSGLMSLVLYSLQRNYPPSIKGLRQWSGALLVLFIAGVLTAVRGRIPDSLSITLAKLAFLLIDLDNFKAVNDTHGHQVGDQVLVNFVVKVRANLRLPDQLGRYGGEEFLVLLPETSQDEALMVANRIREACTVQDRTPVCTVSIGVATNKGAADAVDAMLARADAALYLAKANGRDRVETG